MLGGVGLQEAVGDAGLVDLGQGLAHGEGSSGAGVGAQGVPFAHAWAGWEMWDFKELAVGVRGVLRVGSGIRAFDGNATAVTSHPNICIGHDSVGSVCFNWMQQQLNNYDYVLFTSTRRATMAFVRSGQKKRTGAANDLRWRLPSPR